MAKIAVMGHGVVGSGVVELCHMNSDNILKRTGEPLEISHILDIRDFDDLPYSSKFTKNFEDILNDDQVSVVAEVMGGINPAYDFTKQLLKSGKSVVTSNKELVAEKGAELIELAKKNNVNYFFEASVGGGIPIIRPLHLCLAANKVNGIYGILNGTTNFVLTKMIKDSMDFDEALKLAQKLGYAEKNPAADIEGHDACRKICILASLAYGKHVYPEYVYTEGITKITLDDVKYAECWGGVIKLIGHAKMLNSGKISAMVAPMFVSNKSQLSNIDDVFNGIMVNGNATGDVLFYGKGAGKLPTASAVVADMIDAVKQKSTSCSQTWEETEENTVEDYLLTESRYFIKCMAENSEDVIKAAEKLFGGVSFIDNPDSKDNEYGFVTESVSERAVAECDSEFADSGIRITAKIRVLD